MDLLSQNQDRSLWFKACRNTSEVLLLCEKSLPSCPYDTHICLAALIIVFPLLQQTRDLCWSEITYCMKTDYRHQTPLYLLFTIKSHAYISMLYHKFYKHSKQRNCSILGSLNSSKHACKGHIIFKMIDGT